MLPGPKRVQMILQDHHTLMFHSSETSEGQTTQPEGPSLQKPCHSPNRTLLTESAAALGDGQTA